ncbi:MAG: hypothetical protein MUC59_17000 [Saprospiraceae bacterium]|jgi:hypothetical protein|nr:hypothetical protein [Saprospiraceae bacterium]
MEQLVLNQIKRLPAYLQLEALHYIQYLLSVKSQSPAPLPKPKQEKKLAFSDFHFPEKGQAYSRSEIYGDDGR